jgi:ankyrin repeat protein
VRGGAETGAARIIEAVKRRDRAGVEALLARDPGLAGARTEAGDSPVLTAVYHRADDIVGVLLAHRPPLTAFEAAALGDVARLREALAADPGLVGARSHDGWTLLHLAAFFGRGDAVDALLRAGADPGALSENHEGNTALHAALAGTADMRIVTALLARGADVDRRAAGGFTPLHLAAFRGDTGMLEALLARGADAGARTDDGRTALGIAEAQGHRLVARRLRGETP